MSEMSEARCIGEPVSWLRLETFAARPDDVAVKEHVAACPACRHCLDEIHADVVALPPLVVPVRRRRAWTWWAAPALAVAAAAILLIVLRPEKRDDTTTIKGGGEVILRVQRERAGVITMDATRFAAGDRWHAIVTCAPMAHAWADVAVVELDRGGKPPVAVRADYPLAPVEIACGNGVVIPGAFELTGTRANRVCVRVADGSAPRRDLRTTGDGVACVTIDPE
jgi:hypothetical protein